MSPITNNSSKVALNITTGTTSPALTMILSSVSVGVQACNVSFQPLCALNLVQFMSAGLLCLFFNKVLPIEPSRSMYGYQCELRCDCISTQIGSWNFSLNSLTFLLYQCMTRGASKQPCLAAVWEVQSITAGLDTPTSLDTAYVKVPVNKTAAVISI
jgi:hypothetical protein